MDNLYTFDLPNDLIAQTPVEPRDHARLLVYNRANKTITDDYFYNISQHLDPMTRIVANNTKVDHCRYLFDGAKKEIFVVEAVNDRTVVAMVRPGKLFRQGRCVLLDNDIEATVISVDRDGLRTIEFNTPRSDDRLVRASHVPLPPYIVQNDKLADEYQTIYAKKQGSLAAPTAGLHFTSQLQKEVAKKYGWSEVTLSVGLGTFAPLSEDNFKTMSLHKEEYVIEDEEFQRIERAPHITAVGTTSLRTLEAASSTHKLRYATDIFIIPGYEFKRVNSLITNFHLPSTSLLLLVEAFLGSRPELEKIYTHAIEHRYRFYSFGDAMLIV